MFKINKKIISIITLLFLTSNLAGCSNNAPTKVETPKPDEKINISFTWWGDTKRNEIYNKIVDSFELANPNIKVDRPFGTWAAYWDKLATQIASGNAPDVVGMHQDYVSEYAPTGALLELKPYVDSGIIDTKDIAESVLKGGYVKGKLYMVAQGVVTTGYVFNTATLDEIGVKYPNMDWTWEDFAAKVVEIKEAADAKGVKMWGAGDDSGSLVAPFNYWVRTNGQVLFTEEGKIGFTKETVVSWFNFWKNLRDKKAIPDPATITEYTGLPLEQSLFATGKTALQSLPANQIWLYQNQVKNNGTVNIARVPHLEGKANGEYVEGSFLAITSKSKNPEAAAKFINFFINNIDAQKTFKLEQGVPPTTTAINAITSELTSPQKLTIDFVQNTLKIAGNSPYAPTGVAEIRTRFTEIASSVAFGKQTPEEGAEQFMKVCDEILSRKK